MDRPTAKQKLLKPCIVSINKGTKWDHDQTEKPPVYEFSMEEPAKAGGTHFVKYKRKDFDKFVLYSQRRNYVQTNFKKKSISKVKKLTGVRYTVYPSHQLSEHIINCWDTSPTQNITTSITNIDLSKTN